MRYKFAIGLLAGLLLGLLIFFAFRGFKKDISTENQQNDYYILQNQISRMNKLVVAEQDFSMLQKTTTTGTILGAKVSENKIFAFTKTNAQVSYDLSKMKISVDSVGKKLIIEELPPAQIRITPQVEITSVDDSFLNRVDGEQIKNITENAKKTAIAKVDQNQLRTLGRDQLMKNLDQIFVLAKVLHYQIVDETHSIAPALLQ